MGASQSKKEIAAHEALGGSIGQGRPRFESHPELANLSKRQRKLLFKQQAKYQQQQQQLQYHHHQHQNQLQQAKYQQQQYHHQLHQTNEDIQYQIYGSRHSLGSAGSAPTTMICDYPDPYLDYCTTSSLASSYCHDCNQPSQHSARASCLAQASYSARASYLAQASYSTRASYSALANTAESADEAARLFAYSRAKRTVGRGHSQMQLQPRPQHHHKQQASQQSKQNNNSNSSSSNNNNSIYKQMSIQARHQRGLAFTEEQRKRQGLLGLLPAAVQDQQLQVHAVINFIDRCQDELSKYVYLRHLKDFNEHLFYAALTQNVAKLMPLVYTPTVGLACQRFSEIYLIPRGLYITAKDLGRVASLLANWPEKDVRAIVVTDGERILGLGDLGANGMGISIGKLSLYTALAGIPPENVLPVVIDVGTNNQSLLDDPFYIGLRQKRVRGPDYDALIEEFMEATTNRWGRSCLIQFEDFANSTAFTLLQRYRNKYCTFNDDIQGTASVCTSGLISASKMIGRRLADCTFVFYGAGEANLGTANLLVMAMLEEGAAESEAKRRIWLVDSKGLVVSSRTDLSGHKRAFAQEGPELKELEAIIRLTKPLGIVGASAQGGAFTESVCKTMAEINERPVIFALSNPTSKAECTAQQAYTWTKGKCVFASGSPFDPVVYEGKTYITGQGNNAYIFPGVGLAAIGAHVNTIPEETFLVAARALSDQVTQHDLEMGLVYPPLSKIREVTLFIATRVLDQFYSERLATYRPEPDNKMEFLRSIQYDYRYDTTS